jgi:hypothetical protein
MQRLKDTSEFIQTVIIPHGIPITAESLNFQAFDYYVNILAGKDIQPEDIVGYHSFLEYFICSLPLEQYKQELINYKPKDIFIEPGVFRYFMETDEDLLKSILNNTAENTFDNVDELIVSLFEYEQHKAIEWVKYLHRFTKKAIIDLKKVSIERCFCVDAVHKPYIELKDEINSFETFQEKFNSISKNLFDDFSWDSVVVAGGAITHCLIDTPWLPSSDIDVWVYGPDAKNAFDYILNRFTQLSKKTYYAVNRSIVTLVFEDIDVNVQIIYTELSEKQDIIRQFDMSYVQFLYDGTSVYGTPNAIWSLIHHTTTFEKLPTPIRLLKALHKGFSLCMNDDFSVSDHEEDYKRSLQKYYRLSGDHDRDVYLMELIFRSPVCSTLSGVHKIFTCQPFNRRDYILISADERPLMLKSITDDIVNHNHVSIYRAMPGVRDVHLRHKFHFAFNNVKVTYQESYKGIHTISLLLIRTQVGRSFLEYLSRFHTILSDGIKAGVKSEKLTDVYGFILSDDGDHMYIGARVRTNTTFINNGVPYSMDMFRDIHTEKSKYNVHLRLAFVRCFKSTRNIDSWTLKTQLMSIESC